MPCWETWLKCFFLSLDYWRCNHGHTNSLLFCTRLTVLYGARQHKERGSCACKIRVVVLNIYIVIIPANNKGPKIVQSNIMNNPARRLWRKSLSEAAVDGHHQLRSLSDYNRVANDVQVSKPAEVLDSRSGCKRKWYHKVGGT